MAVCYLSDQWPGVRSEGDQTLRKCNVRITRVNDFHSSSDCVCPGNLKHHLDWSERWQNEWSHFPPQSPALLLDTVRPDSQLLTPVSCRLLPPVTCTWSQLNSEAVAASYNNTRADTTDGSWHSHTKNIKLQQRAFCLIFFLRGNLQSKTQVNFRLIVSTRGWPGEREAGRGEWRRLRTIAESSYNQTI